MKPGATGRLAAGGRPAGAVVILASVLLAGCVTSMSMSPDQARAELQRLPGGDRPVRELCIEQAANAVRRLPIQVRASYRDVVTRSAGQDCVEVVTVLVSVAMEEGEATEAGLVRVREFLAGADAQFLSDTCDEHYRAWQLLRSYTGLAQPPNRGSALESQQYDGWMDRCFRVVRPLALGSWP